MSNFNLLNSSRDLFQKLSVDYTAFNREPFSHYKALDCALCAWHLTDWVYQNYEKASYAHLGDKQGLGAMRNDFFRKCSDLKVMHDITTGLKHFTVDRQKSDMLDSRVSQEDMYTDTYRDSYSIEALMIEFNDGNDKPMLLLLNNVVQFWQSYFSTKPL